ncbi:DEAD-box ATP-dependent RNA helicase 22 [Durusdinium trenchii]|uniref:DEAD-box ATP-dependent RNA helicase 22 n=1 Tax=Durusdinium trenchii TaxID=1381693 RepID=A0ABP0IDJ6_9DINO
MLLASPAHVAGPTLPAAFARPTPEVSGALFPTAKFWYVAPPLAAAILALRGQRSHLVLRARGAFKGYETKRIDTQPGMAPETEVDVLALSQDTPSAPSTAFVEANKSIVEETDDAYDDDSEFDSDDPYASEEELGIDEMDRKGDASTLTRPTRRRLPRMKRSFKKFNLRWTEDGRRVYFDEEGEPMSPFRGLSTASSAKIDGSPKVEPKALQVELAPDGLDPENTIFGETKQDFGNLGITQDALRDALDSLGFRHATRIQAASIPSVLSEDRRAVIMSSETGSGKTLAYLVPAFELILRMPPRSGGERHPNVLILVPSMELGVQVTLVAQQIAKAIHTIERKEIRVSNARRNWPNEVPDILVCTPRAAAQGLAPCQSQDEMARKQALKRIKDVELVVFDEADLLMDFGSQSDDVQTVLTAIAASFPDQPRLVQPKAQVYRPDGIPVEVLNRSLEWKAALAWHNTDGTFKVRFEDGREIERVRRRNLKGPGIGLLVENGPRFVASCATLPSYAKGRCISPERVDMQDNSFYNSGIGSVDWVVKRWYPNAVHIKSPWLHTRHPGIQREAWVYIPGENRKMGQAKGTGKTNLQLRIQKTISILEEQGPEVRTIIFANTAEACLSFEMAAKAAKIQIASVHAGVGFSERIDGLKKFGLGEVPVLVCTDLGARGLDLPICQHVIQLEFAGNTVSYLHRVGRATRAANKSQVTNLWGDLDIPIKDMILQAPNMGLDGEVVSVRGNRCRHRRVRQRQRRNEFVFSRTRENAREARKRTQTRGTEWVASEEAVQRAVQQ